MTKLLFLLLFGYVSVFTSQVIAQTDRLDGENLLQPLPLPVGSWDVFSNKSGTDVRWIEKSDKEMVQTTILRGPGSRVADYKDLDRASGQRNCRDFKAEVFFDGRVNGYEAAIWKSTCQRSDTVASVVLQTAFAGKDAFYLVKKSWQQKPMDDNEATWLNYMRTISLCDSRSSEHPCPDIKRAPSVPDITSQSSRSPAATPDLQR